MLLLIVIVLSSLWFIFFAFQNTQGVTMTLFNYQLTNVPLYLIALGSLLVGLFISWILSMIDSITTGFTIHGKNKTINQANRTINDLQHEIDTLQVENERLKTEPKTEHTPEPLSQRIRHGLSV